MKHLLAFILVALILDCYLSAVVGQSVLEGKVNNLTTVIPPVEPEDSGGQKTLFENLKDEKYKVINSTKENETMCHLLPVDENFNSRVMEALQDGNRLITFVINFPEYPNNPLLKNMSNNYKSNEWYRTYDLHAYTLLSFPFNYKVLSLSTLSHGTTQMEVNVKDEPKGCIATLDKTDMLVTVARIVAKDFNVERSDMYGKRPHACHQYVRKEDNFGVFEFQCCRFRENDGKLECTEHKPALWVRELYKYIAALQVFAFLTGPLFLSGLFFKMSLRKRGYEVKLDEPIKGTLTVDRTSGRSSAPGGDFEMFKSAIQRPQLLDKRLTENKPGKRNISIKRLMLLVDESSLISETEVPVGLFKFLYNDIFFCGIKKWEPFASFFRAGLCGPFGCKYLTWGAVMTFFGATLGILILPFPFYIRMATYYYFEREELEDRSELLDKLGLDPKYEHNLLYYLSPSHPFFIAVFSVYILAFPVLILLRMFNADLFTRVALDSFRDLKEVFKIEAVRLFFTYLLLPLEKFGIWGIIVGVFYWPLAVPFFFVIAGIYCIPTFYMTCRFLILKRPSVLKSDCCRCPVSKAVENLHVSRFPQYNSKVDSMVIASRKKVKTLEDSMLLENVSRKMNEDHWREQESYGWFESLWIFILRLCMGVTCIALMYSILAIFSESVGFFVEVIIFTIMGAIVNANSSAKFIAVALMLIAYWSSCFNSLFAKYRLLNEMIFKQVRDHIHNEIRAVTKQRVDMQISSAFKYLSLEEEKELQRAYVENTRLKYGDPSLSVDVSTIYDHLESINGKLYWSVNSLVFFVDRRDTPRIPNELFFRVSDAENVPDNPGSIPISMFNTFKQLLYMIVFLSFVVLVVVTFHQVYLMSTTNQLILTLGGGFVPLLIKNFMMPAATTKSYADKGFINYAFEGCVTEVVEDFQQTWPVFDLDFDYEDDLELGNESDLGNEPDAQNDLQRNQNNPESEVWTRLSKDVGSSSTENQLQPKNMENNMSVMKTNKIENNIDNKSFQAPRIHLNFSVGQSQPTIKPLGLTENYDEPFDPETVPLTPLNGGELKSSPITGVELYKAKDTKVTLDFMDGKCGVKDLKYV